METKIHYTMLIKNRMLTHNYGLKCVHSQFEPTVLKFGHFNYTFKSVVKIVFILEFSAKNLKVSS